MPRSLRDHSGDWVKVQFEEGVIALDVSVERNLVAILHECVHFHFTKRALIIAIRHEETRQTERALVGPVSIW